MKTSFATSFAVPAFWSGLILSGAVLVSCATRAHFTPHIVCRATPLQWSVRLAGSEIARRGDKLVWQPGGTAKWEYTAGLFTCAAQTR